MREGYCGYTSELTDLSLKARAWNSYTTQASKAYGFSPRDYTHQCNTLQHVQNTLYSYVFFLCVFVCSWKFIWSIDNLTHGMDWGHCQFFCTQNKLVVAARSPNVKGQLRCSSQRPSPLLSNPRTCPHWSISCPVYGIRIANLFPSRAAFCTCRGVKEQSKLSHLPKDVGVVGGARHWPK